MNNHKIPKVIHYFWFGGNPLPEKVKKCIDSWKKYCPDYEIKCWNETNYDYTKNKYMKEAYEAKKWGFVSDYARLDIIYQYGGIYLDTDVELIKNLDPLLNYDCFMGFEIDYVALGLAFGSVAYLDEIKELLMQYNNINFYNEDGSMNLTPITVYTNQYLKKIGLIENGKRQKVGNIDIFPSDFFNPKDYYTGELILTKNTFSIHHFDSSWWGEDEKKEYEKEVLLRKKNIWLWRIYQGFKILKKEGLSSVIYKIKKMKK